MAMTARERWIAIGTGVAALVFVGDRYALTPYVQARKDVAAEQEDVAGRLSRANNLQRKARQMERDWRDMLAGGVKTDQSAAQFQVLEAVGDWAKDAGVNLTSRTPQPETRADRTQIIRLTAIGTCTMASAAKFLWRIETAPVPLKVDEVTLAARKPGSDDLQITVVVSTIWVRPGEPADARTAGGSAAPRRAAAREEGT